MRWNVFPPGAGCSARRLGTLTMRDLPCFLSVRTKSSMPSICLQAAEAVRLFIGVWSRGYGNVGIGELLKAILNDEPVKMRRLAEIFRIDVTSIHHMLLLLPGKRNGQKENRSLEK